MREALRQLWRGRNPFRDTSTDKGAFSAYTEDMVAMAWPWVGGGLAAAALLWWPLDALLYPDQPEVRRAFSAFRLTIVALNLPSALLLRRFKQMYFFAHQTVVGLAALNLGVSGWFLAEAGQGDPLWLAYAYITPQFSVLFLVPLGVRCLASLALVLAISGAWLAHPAGSFATPGVPSILSFLVFCAALAVGIGHAFYLLLQRDFLQRRTVEAQRLELLGLTARLEERVSEQTLALRDLHHRAQQVRTEQRQEIARDLHDGLGQELTSLRLLAGLGRGVAPDGEARELFGELDGLLSQVQGSLRRVLVSLQPQLLDEQGLVEALRVLIGDLERRSGLPISLELRDVPEPLPANVSVALFRIGQEGLNNAIRHARARAVRVRLAGTPQGVSLQIEDDGWGLAEGALGAGQGTRNIRQRAEELGGQAIWRDEGGVQLTVTLPLPELR